MSPQRLRVLILGLYGFLLVASAWIHDDAYITFRTVDNFVHGLGLTWNPGERVQAYTHPLWMFIHAALYALTREIYFTSLAFSILLSMAVVYLLLFRVGVTPWSAVAAGALLVGCKSFTEYSTSGLENPLTHFLLVLFALILYRGGDSPDVFRLALIAALGTLNRPDALLFFVPALVVVLLRRPKWRSFAAAALGFLPLLVWEAFSLVYYGFLVPNTAYAKLGLGGPRSALLEMGGVYLFYSLVNDPMTWLLIMAAGYLVVRKRAFGPGLIMAGAALYLAYVVWIGGDYMGGRFLSAPALVAALALGRFELARPSRKQVVAGLVVVSLCLARSAMAPLSSLREMANVGDERVRFYHATGLANGVFSEVPWPNHFFRHKGEYTSRHGPRLVVDAFVGFLGFYAGPGVHVVDLMGLPDPLLARLPGRFWGEGRIWKPGHVPRPLPEGYLESIASGENRIVDPHLAEYYEKLRRVTRGKFWDRERWRDIVGFHTGAYADLVASYVEDHPDDFSEPPKDLRTLFTIDEGAVLQSLGRH